MARLKCNIDTKGARLRRRGGILILALAAGLALAAWDTRIAWLWYVAAGVAVSGGFILFEGCNGWCVLRAMGFKTKV